jgi:hypothetical protein
VVKWPIPCQRPQCYAIVPNLGRRDNCFLWLDSLLITVWGFFIFFNINWELVFRLFVKCVASCITLVHCVEECACLKLLSEIIIVDGIYFHQIN